MQNALGRAERKVLAISRPRFKDVPEIETVLVDRPDLASVGAGETPIIGIAPAVANALYNATQTRICSLPIRDLRFRAVG